MVTVGFCSKTVDKVRYEYAKYMFGDDSDVVNSVCNESTGNYISKSYNDIIKNAKSDIIVLMHDDVRFVSTERYCETVKDAVETIFNGNDYAVIGCIGSTFVADNGSWSPGIPEFCVGSYVQRYKYHKILQSTYHMFGKGEQFGREIYPVVAVDGMFMMINRNRLASLFDEDNTTFHFYDLDFCISNFLTGRKIGVTKEFLLEHDSEGCYNDEWHNIKSSYYDKKYGKMFPITSLSNDEIVSVIDNYKS